MRKSNLFEISPLVTMMLLASSGCASPAINQEQAECERHVDEAIDSIRLGKQQDDARIDLSLQLAHYVHDHSSCNGAVSVVDKISGLLEDTLDGVRMGAAMALGYIGPPAAKAVPQLKKVIAKSDAIMDSWPYTLLPPESSGSAAREAIREITGERVPDYQEKTNKGTINTSEDKEVP